MRRVRINRVTAQAGAGDVLRAQRIARRAVELLGQQLAQGGAASSRSSLVIDVRMIPGASDEQLARRIAQQLSAELM